MTEGLRQITNIMHNERTPIKQYQKTKQMLRIHDFITINWQTIDFGQCVSGSIQERRLTISLKQNCHEPKIISMAISCEDQQLNELAEYIFGVRRQNNYEYFDEFKFKATQKGSYNFVVGVKTPHLVDYKINARMMVSIEGINDVICIELKQTAKIPFVRCNKELVDEDGFRVLKMAVIKNRSRKETKILFKCSQNLNLTFFAELLGEDKKEATEIEIRPRCIPVGNKGMFILSFLPATAQTGSNRICIRKILILKIKDTPIHFHFPIQITFYPQNLKESQKIVVE